MDSIGLQPYDLLMLAVLILTTVFGAWKGMAWQLASLGSLVISCLVALRLSGPLAPYISQHEPWNRFIAMLILYLLTSLGIWMLFRLVASFIDRVELREFDRQMGALFGLFKGVLLCLVITFFAVTLSEGARQSILKSRSGYYIALLIHRATPAMPQEIRDVLGKYIEQLDRKLDPNTPADESPGLSSRAAQSGACDRCAAGRNAGFAEAAPPGRPEGQTAKTPVFPAFWPHHDRT